MNGETLRYDTETRQRRASDPRASAFVAANAGSGKTHVLVTRILRLLVEGVDPSKILALTYTTAAAANMSNRVFRRLAHWVTLDDDALTKELFTLDEQNVTAVKLKAARRLFARAVETPGGLKIQTIHAFCERVLHLFPFEANVAARFEVLDDKGVQDRLEKAKHAVLDDKALTTPRLRAALDLVIDGVGEYNFDSLIMKMLSRRHSLYRLRPLARDDDAVTADIAVALGLLPTQTSASITKDIYDGRIDDERVKRLIAVFSHSSSSTDQGRAERFRTALTLKGGPEWEKHYFRLFLKADGNPFESSNLATRAIDKIDVSIRQTMIDEQSRVVALIDKRKTADCARRTSALMSVAAAILNHYDIEKIRSASLDFDDLIAKTRALFSRTSAAWVLYKLDQGIDHLLIDEAQDTSPDQWAILRALTEEFHVGETARNVTRTVFAVGDPKQSIYSFQGAKPEAFFESRDLFKKRVIADGRSAFHQEELSVSFRSAAAILDAVDAVFSAPHRYEGLEKESRQTSHQTQRRDAPGLVELWPLVEPLKAPARESWVAPLDEPGTGEPAVRLAHLIADHIQQLIAPTSREFIISDKNESRPIRAGDILILVRNRNTFFNTVIRALKDRGLPVAGADRLKLQSHIAAMDLECLGRVMMTRDDDLALATLLKTPLFAHDDDDLMTLAAERTGSLADALDAKASDPRFSKTCQKIAMLRQKAATLAPFAFYAFVLGPLGGRKAFRARLGMEAEDALDEFLRLALDYEHKATPSLRGFLAEFTASDLEIKRDMDAARNEIRVMTVHGAKGLEAPIVYLPDTASAEYQPTKVGPILDLDNQGHETLPLWSPTKADDSSLIAQARDRKSKLDADEHRRLLYVALTRAKDRLYIAGVTGTKARGKGNWYDMIKEGLSEMLLPVDGNGGDEALKGRLRFTTGKVAKDAPLPPEKPRDQGLPPAWLFASVKADVAAPRIIKPSDIFAQSRPAATEDDRTADLSARRRGRLVHALLEHLPRLPEARRAEAAADWLKVRAADLSPEERHAVAAEALPLFDHPDLKPLFGPDGRAEMPIIGYLTLPDGRKHKISGQIDRLAMTGDEIILADFKTSTRPADSVATIPETIIGQVSLYADIVGRAQPGKALKCLVIYTSGGKIFELDIPTRTRMIEKIVARLSLDGAGRHS